MDLRPILIGLFGGVVIATCTIALALAVVGPKPTTGGATVPLDMHCRADQAIAWSPAVQRVDCVDIDADGKTLRYGGK